LTGTENLKKKIILGILFGIGVLSVITFLAIYHKNPQRKQTLTVGICPFPPYSFKADTDTGYSGFDIELLNALGKKLKMTIRYQEIKFDDAFELLNQKKIDCVPGITIQTSREKIIDFSWPYNKVGIQLMKRANDDSIHGLNDLKGKIVGTTSYTGSPGRYCRELASKVGIADIKYFTSLDEPYDYLLEGKIDAVIIDHPVNEYYHKKTHGRLIAIGGLLTQEFFGLAVAKGNNSLRQQLNNGMQKIMASGEYARIYNKYIDDFSEKKATNQQKDIHKRKLIVGYYIFPPYCMKVSKGEKLTGFDVELLRAIAKDQNLKLTFQEISFKNIITLLKEHKVDLLTGLTITPEREQYIDFSWPYNLISQQLMVTSESNIKSIYDLQGKNVGCVAGTALDYCAKLQAKGIVEKVTLCENFDKLFLTLISGKIDGIVNELPVNLYYMDKYAGDLKNVGKPLTREYAGFGLPKGADTLKDYINKGINNVMASGTYSKLYNQFLGQSNIKMNQQIEVIKNLSGQKETIQPQGVK
jgi:polar amino acid transport system substrate-binding protein